MLNNSITLGSYKYDAVYSGSPDTGSYVFVNPTDKTRYQIDIIQSKPTKLGRQRHVVRLSSQAVLTAAGLPGASATMTMTFDHPIGNSNIIKNLDFVEILKDATLLPILMGQN